MNIGSINSIYFQGHTRKCTKTNSGESKRISRAQFKQQRNAIILNDIIQDSNLRKFVPNRTIIVLQQSNKTNF